MSDGDAVQLCCLLWAREGEAAGLKEYEDRVLALIPEHGGQVVQRLQSIADHGQPSEAPPAPYRGRRAVRYNSRTDYDFVKFRF